MIVKEPVPALAADTDIKVVPIVAETPEQKEVPVAEVIMVTPAATEAVAPAPAVQETTPAPVVETQQLPQTASQLPLIVLLGLGSLGAALVLKRFSN